MTHTRKLTSILATAALGTALTTGLLPGATAAASANATTEIDVRGDAPRALDVTKVGFRYDASGAHARVHVADLRRQGEFVFAVMNRKHSLRYGLAATGHRDGSVTRTFYRFRDGTVSERRCRGSHVRWSVRQDVITLSFPERCFSKLGRKVAMAVGSTRGFPAGVTVDDGPVSALRKS